jgi:hypothetical protein
MPRLVVNPGSPTAWEIHLNSGVNSIGRRAENDFQVSHPSVSGSHCQIIVNEQTAAIKDLGSTNGTFVNRVQVSEAVLQSGQAFRLGEVEMVFYADSPAGAAAAEHLCPPIPVAIPLASATAPQVSARTEALATSVPVKQPSHRPSLVSSAASMVGPQFCRFHPKSAARYRCEQCQHYFCEACVAVRKVGGVSRKFCRHCDAECAPVEVNLGPPIEKGFFERLSGAFAYPLRGGGLFIVLAGIIIFAMVELGLILIRVNTLRTVIFGCIMDICAGGYLFTYLQSILHSTAAEDKELPDLPGISNFADDVVFPFFRLVAIGLLCLGPALGTGIWFAATKQPAAAYAFLAAGVFGAIHFPMAFLAVAILDSLAAVNPIVVVSSILKVPGEYLVALLALGVAVAVDVGGDLAIAAGFPDGWQTISMGVLFAMIGAKVFLSFLTMYLLLVAIHVLGLVFAARKETLGWMAKG